MTQLSPTSGRHSTINPDRPSSPCCLLRLMNAAVRLSWRKSNMPTPRNRQVMTSQRHWNTWNFCVAVGVSAAPKTF